MLNLMKLDYSIDRNPLFVVGNYAAHPLCAHSPGRGGLRISSDFPGFFRRYVKSETGAEAMFVQGACGDVVPKDDELGLNAAKRVGEALAEEAISSIIDVQRNAARFVMQKPRVASLLGSIESPILKRQRHLYDGDKVKLEIQCVSIGDIAFVGVPGELVNELGLEMKWHSPFRRTFIAYAATDYFGYISTVNQVAAGVEPALCLSRFLEAGQFGCRYTCGIAQTSSRRRLFFSRSISGFA